MKKLCTILVIDSDIRRRATIAHVLAGTGLHVEPFESIDEIMQCLRQGRIVLACDEGFQVRDLVTRIADAGSWLPVVAYAAEPSTPRVVRAVLDGAASYLEWPFSEIEVRKALNEADASEAQRRSERVRETIARSKIRRLTPREREVLAGVADGLSNRSIAERLAISSRTVEIHRANLLNKMGARHTSEAIRIAIEGHLALASSWKAVSIP